ncbi:MAG: hypothetical protein CSB34_05855 [Desulfobulbus propionicus]|nr:MAG: hypothetical protein CSB34_05855 [Desulfobulbus propionicus]
MPSVLSLVIVHQLPGRLRLRLSRPLRDPDRLLDTVKGHEGLVEITYTQVSRSVMARFDPLCLHAEEVTLRVALAFGLDAGAEPVFVRKQVRHEPIQASAWVAGAMLMVAVGMRMTGQQGGMVARWERLAGMGTAAAVVHHGWRDIREQGYFDPGVLSLGYLVTAFLRGNLLWATSMTWAATFIGRNLLQGRQAGIIVRPVQAGSFDGVPHYEIAVSSDVEGREGGWLLMLARGFTDLVLAEIGGHDMLGDMRHVARVHGEELEGMGWMPNGIPLRFKNR